LVSHGPAWHIAIVRLTTPAIEQGLIGSDVDARDILRAIGGLRVFDDRPDAALHAQRLASLLVDGLRHRAHARPSRFNQLASSGRRPPHEA
jgi:hypothetical protein